MKRLFAVAAVLCALLLSGCVDKGTVVDKKHTDAYTSYTYMMVGKTGMIMPIHNDESWSLLVEDNGEKGWVDVDQQTYDEYDVGEYYPSDSQ